MSLGYTPELFDIDNENIITGFHIQTRDQQFLSIESSRENIMEIWNSPIVQALSSFCFIFFDSSISMSERDWFKQFIIQSDKLRVL